jgi:hypothetical protein
MRPPSIASGKATPPQIRDLPPHLESLMLGRGSGHDPIEFCYRAVLFKRGNIVLSDAVPFGGAPIRLGRQHPASGNENLVFLDEMV